MRLILLHMKPVRRRLKCSWLLTWRNETQLAMASTPEGYKIMYELFCLEADKPDRRLIKAATTENPYLPEGFIESLSEL